MQIRTRLWSGFLLISTILLTTLIAWATRRGVYMLDESYYPFMVAHPDRFAITSTGVGYLLHALTGWLFPNQTPDIPTFRLLALGASLLGGTLFTVGFWPWFQQQGQTATGKSMEAHWSPWTLWLFLLTGNLAGCLLDWRSLNYNSMNNFLMLVASGALFRLLAIRGNTRNARIGRVLLLMLSGLAIGLDAVVKFPTAGLLLVSALAVILWISGHQTSTGARKRWSGLLLGSCLALGLSAALLGYFSLLQSPAEWQAQFLPLMRVTAQGCHAVGFVLKAHLLDVLSLLKTTLTVGLLPLLVIGLSNQGQIARWLDSTKKQPHTSHQATLIFGLIVSLALLCSTLLGHLYRPELASVRIFWLLLLCAPLALQPRRISWKPTITERGLGLLLLLLLPVFTAFGTGVSLLTVMYGSLLPWFALLACLTETLSYRVPVLSSSAVISRVLSITAVLLVWGHAGFGLVQHPITFCQQALTTQTAAMPELSRFGSLLVDPQTRQNFLQLHQRLQAAGFRPGQRMLAFYHMPGLVYLLGGEAYGGGYYMAGPEYEAENCHFLTRQNRMGSQVRPDWILLNTAPSPDFTTCLRSHGIDLQTGYQEIGTVSMPAGFFYWTPTPQTLHLLKALPRLAANSPPNAH